MFIQFISICLSRELSNRFSLFNFKLEIRTEIFSYVSWNASVVSINIQNRFSKFYLQNYYFMGSWLLIVSKSFNLDIDWYNLFKKFFLKIKRVFLGMTKRALETEIHLEDNIVSKK